MHHGIVAAAAPSQDLIAALDAEMPGLRLGTQVGSLDDLNLEPTDEGWTLACGELGGRAFILDTSLLLSADGDIIVAASKALDTVVVGCGAETTSGSYWLFAADRGNFLRGYWACHTDMYEPWSTGEPLAMEGEVPLEDLDGDGMVAALASFGFDYRAWSSRNDLRELIFTPPLESLSPRQGGISTELEAFRQMVAIPEGKQPRPTVVKRDGGFDLATKSPSKTKGGGLFGFLRRG
jgi:hypothetical protein